MNKKNGATNFNNEKIAIIGLGYVGLPLAVAFGRAIDTIGYDINEKRISELKNFYDNTNEIQPKQIKESHFLKFSSQAQDLADCTTYIITVPSPVDEYKKPDLKPLIQASIMVGKFLNVNDVVIYESTVYPGCVEEDLVPVLENVSKLKFNRDFFCGYSPERINPGDASRRLENITKVTSGSDSDTADFVNSLYSLIIDAGTHQVSSIKIAEAAKVIENVQRDVNIALINELAMLFSKLDIDTEAVLAAASTKWNFLNFRPGLVGGHCIGVDPYYLTHKAEQLGYHTKLVKSGREINDSMPSFIVSKFIKWMLKNHKKLSKPKVLVAGLTFKENCPDLRNSKVFDVVRELEEYGVAVEIFDPWVSTEVLQEGVQRKIILKPESRSYDGIIVAVAHDIFREIGEKTFREFGKPGSVFMDLKYLFNGKDGDIRL